jgi:hypothetical protein
LDGRNYIILVFWICGGIRRKAVFFVVRMIDVCVEVDGVISHGVDLANALKLKVVRLRSIKTYADDGANIQRLVVLIVAIPPGVGDLPGKADESRCPLLVNKDNMLALGDRRRHRDGADQNYCDSLPS